MAKMPIRESWSSSTDLATFDADRPRDGAADDATDSDDIVVRIRAQTAEKKRRMDEQLGGAA